MRVSVQVAMWLSVVFAVLCITYGVVGLNSIGADATAMTREDAHGFAMFWLFLGAIGAICAGGSWWLLRGGQRANDE